MIVKKKHLPWRDFEKAKAPEDAKGLENIPNIGVAIAADLRFLGIEKPSELIGLQVEQDAYRIFQTLNAQSKQQHDPCVMDALMAAIAFMNGQGIKPWWHYTPKRKDWLKQQTSPKK